MYDLWKEYFDGAHDAVIKTANERLFAHHAPDNLHIMGLALCAAGQPAEGIARLRASLLLYPGTSHWFANAAIAALNCQQYADSESFSRDGLARYNREAPLWFSLGNALMMQGKVDDARVAYVEALAINPDLLDARLNLGNCYRRQDRNTEALACYEAVLRSNADHGPAAINKAGILMETDHELEAERILLTTPSVAKFPEATFMRAMIRLGQGDFAEGWKLYSQRWDCSMSMPDRQFYRRPRPKSLADMRGKHVAISHEQGFGDSLQFIRYLPLLQAHAERMSVVVPPPLIELFQAAYPDVLVTADRNQLGEYDYEMPMLDAPLLLGTTVDTIPARLPYFKVPAEIARTRALPPTTKKLRVGLVWAGQLRPNPDLAAVDRRRSTKFETLAPLFQIPDVQFVSLQLGEPALQADPHPWRLDMLAPLNNTFTFLDTAAILKQIDVLVSVDTAIVHLAAGLGVKTFMLSRYDICWRWLRGRQDSPYYPDALKIFQQATPGDWSEPVGRIAQELLEMVNG